MTRFNLKGFVEDVLVSFPEMKSKEIVEFLHKKGHTEVTWQMIAAIKGKMKC